MMRKILFIALVSIPLMIACADEREEHISNNEINELKEVLKKDMYVTTLDKEERDNYVLKELLHRLTKEKAPEIDVDKIDFIELFDDNQTSQLNIKLKYKIENEQLSKENLLENMKKYSEMITSLVNRELKKQDKILIYWELPYITAEETMYTYILDNGNVLEKTHKWFSDTN